MIKWLWPASILEVPCSIHGKTKLGFLFWPCLNTFLSGSDRDSARKPLHMTNNTDIYRHIISRGLKLGASFRLLYNLHTSAEPDTILEQSAVLGVDSCTEGVVHNNPYLFDFPQSLCSLPIICRDHYTAFGRMMNVRSLCTLTTYCNDEGYQEAKIFRLLLVEWFALELTSPAEEDAR